MLHVVLVYVVEEGLGGGPPIRYQKKSNQINYCYFGLFVAVVVVVFI